MSDPRPPRLARGILARLLPPGRGDELVADLDEEYADRRHAHGAFAAGAWYWGQVVRPSTTNLGRELREVRTMKVGRHKVPGVAPKSLLDLVTSEARFAFRSIRHRPGFSALVILTLGLGIGANTAIFTVVNGVLLQPLAYPSPDELIVVGRPAEVGWELRNMSLDDLVDAESESALLESLVGYSQSNYTLTGMGDATLVSATRVHRGLLSTFQLSPVSGRDIVESESGVQAARVAVIGHGFWQDRFQGDGDVLGQTFVLNNVSYQVIGVAPVGFDFPDATQVWLPIEIDPEDCARGCHAWNSVGRLAAGGGVEALNAELGVLSRRLSDAYPDTNFEKAFVARSLRDDVVGEASTGIWLLLGAGLAVLLIACANVANLILARSETRRGEASVRAAMGASRGRLVLSMLSESALLALLGGALGLGLAFLGVRFLPQLSAEAIPRIDLVTINGPVLAFTLSLVLGVTLLFGLSPALRASRSALVSGIRRSGRGGAIGGDRRLRQVLTVTQTALAVVLLFGAGLMLRTFAQMYAVDPGFETDDVLRFTVSLPGNTYSDLESIRTFFRTLETNIGEHPGVDAVGSIFGAPLGRGNVSGDVLVDGRPEPAPGDEIGGSVRPISPGYLRAMGIPIVHGRDLTDADDRSDVPVAIVNEALARALFGEDDPLGQRVRVTVSLGFDSPYWEVVGVSRNVKSTLTGDPVNELYMPQGQFGPGLATVNVRSSVPALSLVDFARAEVARLDANVPLRNVETVSEAVRRHMAPTRFLLIMVAVFAGLALLLAAVGLYGVMAYLVSRRQREIGVRVALGARPGEIRKLVLVGGLGPALLGLGIGLLTSLAGGRIVEGVLFGVTPRDPLTLLVVPALLVVVAVAAVLIPAGRATRLDPTTVLRAE